VERVPNCARWRRRTKDAAARRRRIGFERFARRLDSAADEKRAERDQRIASGDLREASTQQLLADMYANATDEERVSLRGAAVTGAKKRGEIKV